ncbi:MAG: hypothetical protein ABII94_01085 [Patescibacteria group bacterium]|nr:hypothetical protein [Patescibacteria group bacterium]MBU1987206.1 hypothetical protein [Patescibacteria group bacterium]
MFQNIGKGVKEMVIQKTREYDRRIKEIIINSPNDPRLKGALEDFKQWTKQEWSEDFDIEEYIKNHGN